MKYLIVITPNGLPVPVVFGDAISHVDVSESLRKAGCVTQSAGFVRLGEIEPICVGESTSLGLKPGAGDADLIRIHHQISAAQSILFGVHALPLDTPKPEPATLQPMQFHLPAN